MTAGLPRYRRIDGSKPRQWSSTAAQFTPSAGSTKRSRREREASTSCAVYASSIQNPWRPIAANRRLAPSTVKIDTTATVSRRLSGEPTRKPSRHLLGRRRVLAAATVTCRSYGRERAADEFQAVARRRSPAQPVSRRAFESVAPGATCVWAAGFPSTPGGSSGGETGIALTVPETTGHASGVAAQTRADTSHGLGAARQEARKFREAHVSSCATLARVHRQGGEGTVGPTSDAARDERGEAVTNSGVADHASRRFQRQRRSMKPRGNPPAAGSHNAGLGPPRLDAPGTRQLGTPRPCDTHR